MSHEDLVAAAALLGVILYGVLGGADFGGGILDLFASGPRRDQQRAAIAHAMGPVWEANHVWLIFVIVILFTAFPPAFAALSVGLFGVFHFVLLGITLRGAAFVFRGASSDGSAQSGDSRWGTIFGVASVIAPALLGMTVGAISSGGIRVVQGQVQLSGPTPWLTPVSLVIGALALSLCVYQASIYMTNETRGDLREDFRRQALYSGTFVVAISVIALPFLHFQTPHLWRGLASWRAAPIVIAGVVAALLSGWALLRSHFRLARVACVAQVSLLVMGWGLAQHPYLIYPDVTLTDAAAPKATLLFMLYILPAGLLLVIPSLWMLFRIFKSDRATVA